MKTTVKPKMPPKAKPGQLLSSHIEYDHQGDGATVTHMHEPEAGQKNDPWTAGPAANKKSFGSRMEAHHHMAQAAGVPAEIANAVRAHGAGDSSDGQAGPGESEGDEDEDQAEDRGGPSQPGAQPSLSFAGKPARKV